MISPSLAPASERELEALQNVLERYHDVSKRDVTETLARKANDIRIQLFRGYFAQRFKGSRAGAKRSEGIAFRQMRQRAKAGDGIRMRVADPSTSAPLEYYQRRKLRGAHGTARRLRVPVKMSRYQRRVWTELARRQAGIGVLGVAFLMQRWRSKGALRHLAANRTGLASFLDVDTQRSKFSQDVLGRITLAPSFARIEGMVPGHAIVGERHSILAIALRDVRIDTEKYLTRKAEQSLKAEIEGAGVRTA